LRYGEIRLRYDKFHAGIGKYPQEFPGGTVLLGNCNQKFKERGIFIQGCPQISSYIFETLQLPRHFSEEGWPGPIQENIEDKKGANRSVQRKEKKQLGFHRVSTFCYLKYLETF
jgi:hypothetical protein